MLYINIQVTEKLFAEFQMSLKILERLPEKNSELMGIIKHILIYKNTWTNILMCNFTTKSDKTGNLVIYLITLVKYLYKINIQLYFISRWI